MDMSLHIPSEFLCESIIPIVTPYANKLLNVFSIFGNLGISSLKKKKKRTKIKKRN